MKSRILLVLFVFSRIAAAQFDAHQNPFAVKGDPAADLNSTFAPAPSGTIAASDLAVPARARKEFVKSNELIAKQDVKDAIKKLNNAIAIYPNYALAYNNLGALYARLGDHVREQQALGKAISLDDHFALAYLNLGRMYVNSGDFTEAQKALVQASALDPAEPVTLVLLAYAQFSGGRFDEAITTGRRAHQLWGPHAFAHRIASRAFLYKNDAQNAIRELELCLKEEPTGTRADHARLDLETIEGSLRENAKQAAR